IDERRLLRRLDDLAQRGALPQGGIYRPLYSPQWTSAMELVATWMKDAGLLVRRDPVGNMWGRIEGSRGGRVIATGSHIDAMRGVGQDPAAAPTAVRRDLDVFVELHVEQGPILEDHGPRLGVVTTIAGTAHLEITVRGQPDHAGAMAMDRRRDAFLGASAMALGIAEAAVRMGHPAVATVGTIVVEPSQVNVVPGLATCTVDTR